MKQLESIGLVQYFLYARQDLDVGRNTAFLGPNGTGKTALLDALQIVLLGADRNRIHFNASSEGKRRARSLRDYCLGVHGQRPSDVCRDSANTYINLVFRDPDTGTPVTAGAALSASVDSQEHLFHSLYILPGVSLRTDQMVEAKNGQEMVLPWRTLQPKLADLCRAVGTTPVFTINGEEFSRQLFGAQLASSGESPNYRAIRTAFARSLKLNRDVDDLNETLRNHLIEARPTNVNQFRARLDQFREIKRTIQELAERLSQAEAVEKQYRTVQQHFVKAANYTYLKAVFNADRLGEEIAETEETIEHLIQQEAGFRSALSKAESDVGAAHKRLVSAEVALKQDPDYLRHLSSQSELDKGRDGLASLRSTIRDDLGRLGTAVRRVVGNKDLARLQGDGAHALEHVSALSELLGREADIQPEDTLVLANAVSTLHRAVDSVRMDLAQQLAAANHSLTAAKADLGRVNAGRPPLRSEVSRLQSLLEGAGIQTTPVCDLVEVKDVEWQPAIEAYLGRNVDALLVHDTADETAAIDVFRRARNDIYGSKLALISRGRSWQAPGSGKYAAQLITGDDNGAIRFLQGELGKVALVEDSEQLRVGNKALSRDGMVSSGGGVDRLRLMTKTGLRIGGVSNEDHVRAAREALRKADELYDALNRRVEHVSTISQALASAGDSDTIQVRLQSLIGQIVNQQAAITQTEMIIDAGEAGSLAALQLAASAAAEQHAAKDKAKTEAASNVDKAVSALKGMREKLKQLTDEQASARDEEVLARQNSLCDLNAAETLREVVETKTGDDVSAAIMECSRLRENSTSLGNSANTKAWGLMTTYLANYQLENHEIRDEDWQQALAMVQSEIKRMSELELVEKQDEANRAYTAAVEVFRSDVAHTLLNGFDAIEEQIKGLNRILNKAPEFTNGERYQFRATKVDQHRKLYEFLQRVREMGESESTLFGGSGPIPEEFRLLVEGDGKGSPLQLENSPLNDHRLFFSYDVDIYADGDLKGKLSKRFGPGSGGEHRTPLYVIFGASLAAAFGKPAGTPGCGGLIMLDEAFEKMDAQNVRATAEYLNALGLQMIIAGPESDQAKMSSFLDVYWDMARFGSKRIQLFRNEIKPAARELLASDILAVHPELMEEALVEVSERSSG
ncbi:SbcC/MukB-like Walker B domain-containing protein [Solilutibacter tolerans]|uniref:Chromosome segregation ATPase n=1 Tax=Solilutibacter tolerans TaxID=1604334 RepID=A0A1N6N3Y3_9GAMM|nr:SbcC/MukB-like Walker B domain-containing protein [Lysobacter tolerans]SIP86790.1 Chromosome segregation ATPase [Lysobacter tolerans]